MSGLLSAVASSELLSPDEVARLVSRAMPVADYRGRRLLLIIPDGTRTAPIGLMFQSVFAHVGEVCAALDILVALGTHPPMSEAAICARLDISPEERRTRYGKVRFFNHEWDNPAALRQLGCIPADEIAKLSEGRFSMEVPVAVNARVFDYDQLVIIGPVFPHECVGFSGGNKYLFPGVGGPEILNFFHWLAAVITTMDVIGHKWTPVRRVIDRAGAMVSTPKLCFALIVKQGGLAGLFAGTPETAWDAAADLSAKTHIIWTDRTYHTIMSVAPAMYDELWVGGKCMYKLEPVLAENGELIIYAPHLHEVSSVHGHLIREVGYHCRDYFLTHWERFKHLPWATLAHSTHVFGQGTYEKGIEQARARVTLATGISEAECHRINLGFRDWRTLRLEDFQNREAEGILFVPKAGETLYRPKEGRAGK